MQQGLDRETNTELYLFSRPADANWEWDQTKSKTSLKVHIVSRPDLSILLLNG